MRTILLEMSNYTNMETKKQIADKLLYDMKFQEVTYRDAAKIFGTARAGFFCDLKHEDRYLKIPVNLWVRFRKYYHSGVKLKDFTT